MLASYYKGNKTGLIKADEISEEHPHPSTPPPPWLPSGRPPNTSPSIQTTVEVEKMEPDKEIIKVLEDNPKGWRPGLTELARLAKDLVQEHPRPGRPAPPWPSSDKIAEPRRPMVQDYAVLRASCYKMRTKLPS